MKKSIYLILILSIVYAACKKSNSSVPTKPYMTADLNGVASTFNDSFYFVNRGAGSFYLVGYVDSTKYSDYFVINFATNDNSKLTTRVYLPSDPISNLAINYYHTSPVYGYMSFFGVGNSDTLTITSVTSSSIAGTFSTQMASIGEKEFEPGLYMEYVDSSITVTNGKFYISWKP